MVYIYFISIHIFSCCFQLNLSVFSPFYMCLLFYVEGYVRWQTFYLYGTGKANIPFMTFQTYLLMYMFKSSFYCLFTCFPSCDNRQILVNSKSNKVNKSNRSTQFARRYQSLSYVISKQLSILMRDHKSKSAYIQISLT